MRDDPVRPPGEPPSPRAPSVWPVFVVVGASLALTIAAQIVLVVLLVAANAAQDGAFDPDSIEQLTEDFFLSPAGFMLMAGIGQLSFIGCVLVATWRLPGSRVEQLGLRRTGLSGSSYVALVAGTGVPLAVGVGLSLLVSQVIEPMIDPKLVWSKITALTFAPYVLFIALAPGFIEEITFRGFVQRRLLRRWSPMAAIACSSALFAVAHMDPHHAAFAFPIGVWFGVIAWRLGVIWPGIACHAALNGLWSIYFIGAVKTEPSTGFYIASAVVVGVISVVGFVASLRILSKATIPPGGRAADQA
jgi:membrane protease YdiL (CAAX protease family)